MTAPVRCIASVLCSGAVLLSAGCATVVRGTTQKVEIRSVPAGASVVAFPSRQTATTPATLKLDRDRAHTLRLEHAGSSTGWVYLDPTTDGDAILPYLGNVILGGLIGMVVDMTSGALYELQPTPVDVVLEPAGEPPSSPAAP